MNLHILLNAKPSEIYGLYTKQEAEIMKKLSDKQKKNVHFIKTVFQGVLCG